ncbi:MAG: hypothetical protein HGA87_06855 [Desulfobulbaceae bacterium]|jgi:hypothetical protein|nr:hypothetical protein [Desulfobulbaceae bacterium]
MNDVLRSITADLDWRESEIASMRVFLAGSSLNKGQEKVLLRAAWALLYAHYEGFCKNALSIFYDHILSLPIVCQDLPQATKVFALRRTLKQLRSLPESNLLGRIETFSIDHSARKPVFPEIETDSNLWPSRLRVLLIEADLSTFVVDTHELKLKTLVARRNCIAHGERDIIKEVSYYRSFEDAVYEVMYDLAYQIEERLQRAPY